MPDQAVVEETKRVTGRVVGRNLAREIIKTKNVGLLVEYWTLTIQKGENGPEVLFKEKGGQGRTLRIDKTNLAKETREG